MSVTSKIKRALRGRVSVRAAVLEAGRRGIAAVRLRGERAQFANGKSVDELPRARLAPGLARLGGAELLEHFRTRAAPRLCAGFEEAGGDYLSARRGELESEAREVTEHRWPLLGYGVREFDATVDWLREPASGSRWALGFHGDVRLV